MEAQVLRWYISLVALVMVAVGAFGMGGPWMVSQPDSLTVFLGFLIYIVGVPVVGFMGWKLVKSILDYQQRPNTEEVQ